MAHLLRRSALAALILALPPTAPARADEVAILQLEQQMRAMEARHQAEMARLEAEIAALQAGKAQSAPQPAAAPPPAAPAPAPTAPTLVESPTHQFGISSPDGQTSIALIARLHFDAGDYLHVTPTGGARGAGPGSLNSGVNARRARLGLGGTFEGDWAYRLIYEFGGSSDSLTPGAAGADASGVENAYITYNGFNRPERALPLAVDFGYMDVPWTLDEATSSNDIMFLERSSAQVVASEFGGGDDRSALELRSNSDRRWSGLALTGPTSGAPHTGANIGSTALLGRTAYQLWDGRQGSLHLGLNLGHMFNSRVNSTTTGSGGISTTAALPALALADRPELRLDPTTLLDSGNIPFRAGSVGGVEAATAQGGLFAQGELYHYTVDQLARGTNPADGAINLAAPQLAFNGGYLEASYSIGGTRHYIPATGAYSGVIPDHPFALKTGGWGAWELAARYSEINLNDHFTPGTAPHLSGGVNGGLQQGLDLGLNWYANANIRFMLDYIHTEVSDLYKTTGNGSAPTTPAGATIDAVALRSQFAF
ncbi:porin O precursor [mine drainage metagenome]|uniref:Porin O n=1 Tax=mine drainage metagenome TaxID=410659 RepID=A0A1J5REL3_9ZZZZ